VLDTSYKIGFNDIYRNGVDLIEYTPVIEGDISFDHIVELDTVVAYNTSIQADDAVAVLRHIVELDSLADGSVNWHSGDVRCDSGR